LRRWWTASKERFRLKGEILPQNRLPPQRQHIASKEAQLYHRRHIPSNEKPSPQRRFTAQRNILFQNGHEKRSLRRVWTFIQKPKAKPSKKSVDSFGQNGQFGTLFVSGRQNPFWCTDLQKGSRKTFAPKGVEILRPCLFLGAPGWSWDTGLLLRGRCVAV